MREDLPMPRARLLGIDGRDYALRAVASRCPCEERWVVDPRRVDAHLVRAGIEQRANIIDSGDTATDGQRDEHLISNGLDHAVQQSARLNAGLDIQERDLVRTLLVVAAGHFDRIARVLQIDEIDSLDDAALRDVEAGNDSFRESHNRGQTPFSHSRGQTHSPNGSRRDGKRQKNGV